jgi:hypothetical protein
MGNGKGEYQGAAEAVSDQIDLRDAQRIEKIAEVAYPQLLAIDHALGPVGKAEADHVGRDHARPCARVSILSRQLAQAETPGPEPWIISKGRAELLSPSD